MLLLTRGMDSCCSRRTSICRLCSSIHAKMPVNKTCSCCAASCTRRASLSWRRNRSTISFLVRGTSSTTAFFAIRPVTRTSYPPHSTTSCISRPTWVTKASLGSSKITSRSVTISARMGSIPVTCCTFHFTVCWLKASNGIPSRPHPLAV